MNCCQKLSVIGRLLPAKLFSPLLVGLAFQARSIELEEARLP